MYKNMKSYHDNSILERKPWFAEILWNHSSSTSEGVQADHLPRTDFLRIFALNEQFTASLKAHN